MALHIFWDNSNIFGGAKEVKIKKEAMVPSFALRVHFRNLYGFVLAGRDVITKVMAGSVPPECDDLWEYARELGFNTDLLKRVESDNDTTKEQTVDELLHLKMANCLLDFDPPQTMAVLTGDASTSDFGTSFPKQIERALKKNWTVEIYSWGPCINPKRYDDLLRVYGSKINLIFFDAHYEKLTFVKGGEYYRKDPATGEKIYFTVPERRVLQL